MNTALQILSRVFGFGVWLRHLAYRRGWLPTGRLNRPVISVGNLSVGGTGKTPLIILTARVLVASGHRPCILTRGYGGSGGKEPIFLEPGAGHAADPRVVGDEPAALAKELPEVLTVVSPDRLHAGRIAEQRFPITVHLLDDGFQHLGLYRDLDIVLLDVSRRFEELALLPAGCGREPFSALRRADWVVMTRWELGDADGWQERVQRVQPQARIFRCSTRFGGLVDARTGTPQALENLLHKKVAAFCGIGNPSAFFADLRHWGFGVMGESIFPDHHVYKGSELDALFARWQSEGVEAVLTTQKDVMNLPEDWNLPLPLLACCIHSEIEDKREFEQALLAAVKRAHEKTR